MRQPLIAYFSAEFGLTECLSIFAGGLGILAGDHLKSASELGIPLIGVGLLYQPDTTLPVGAQVQVKASVQLGSLSPQDVAVELYLGRLNPTGDIVNAHSTPMKTMKSDSRGNLLFEAATPCSHSGMHRFTVRVRPSQPDLAVPFLPGLIAWADANSLAAG